MQFLNELLKTLLQTFEELVGLVAMFAVVQLTGSLLLGAVIGLVVFEIEAALDKLARGVPPLGNLGLTQVVVATETVWWIVSFVLIDGFGPVAAGALLTVTMVFQHTWEDNLAHHRGLFAPFVNLETLPASVLEGVIAGGAWLYVASGQAGVTGVEQIVLAVLLLYVGLGPEHVLGRRLALAP
jgi:hypothetical protein